MTTSTRPLGHPKMPNFVHVYVINCCLKMANSVCFSQLSKNIYIFMYFIMKVIVNEKLSKSKNNFKCPTNRKASWLFSSILSKSGEISLHLIWNEILSRIFEIHGPWITVYSTNLAIKTILVCTKSDFLPKNCTKSHQYLTNVQCCNRRNHGQTYVLQQFSFQWICCKCLAW